MISNTLPVELSGTIYDAPSMVSDSRGFPHVAWLKNGTLGYSHYNGIGWEFVNDTAEVDSATKLYKRSLALNIDGVPMMVYSDDTVLKHKVLKNDAWGSMSESPVVFEDTLVYSASTAQGGPFYYVAAIINTDGVFELVVYKNDGTGWSFANSMQITDVSSSSDIIITPDTNGSTMWIAWNSLGSIGSWISFMCYGVLTDDFYTSGSGIMEASYATGNIRGFDIIKR